MEQRRRLSDDGTRVRLDEAQAHHPGDEHRAVGALGVAIHMAVFVRDSCGEVRQTRGDGAVDVAAELGAQGEPEPVEAGVAAVGRLDASQKVEAGLFARSPGTAGILLPLLAQLSARHADAILLETPNGNHFVIPVVVDGQVTLSDFETIDPFHRGDLVLEGHGHDRPCNLRRPDRPDAVPVVVAREPHDPRLAGGLVRGCDAVYREDRHRYEPERDAVQILESHEDPLPNGRRVCPATQKRPAGKVSRLKEAPFVSDTYRLLTTYRLPGDGQRERETPDRGGWLEGTVKRLPQIVNGYENRSLNSSIPFSQTSLRKISGEASCFNRPRVSRATHLPASLAASGLLF